MNKNLQTALENIREQLLVIENAIRAEDKQESYEIDEAMANKKQSEEKYV